MNHDKIRLLVSSSIDGEVSEDEKIIIVNHIAGCNECKLFIEQINQLKSGIRNLDEYELDSGFASWINEITVIKDEQSEKWLSVERLARNMVVAFSMLAIAFIAISFLNKGASPTISEVLIDGSENDSLTVQMLLSSEEISKNDLLYAAMTK